MTEGVARLAKGGRIDRARPLRFRFAGKLYIGYAGDTLASALLANGIHLVARSFKYHRPRGILTAGAEEPNALLRITRGDGRVDPNTRATTLPLFNDLDAAPQNCRPGLRFDLQAINGLLGPLFPAGFYYKTFMWPASFWKRFYEPRIRAAAGLGEAPRQPDPDRYLHRFAHCEVLIAGGGPAGIAAALAATRAGARVILAEEQPQFGGWLTGEGALRARIDGEAPDAWLEAALAELRAAGNCRLLPRTSVFGCYDHNLVGLLEDVADHKFAPAAGEPRHRLWKVRAARVVIATGMTERPLVFPANDRPGIMMAGAAATYLHRHAVLPGREIVIVTNNDSVYGLAGDFVAAGARVTLADARREIPDSIALPARNRGVELLPGTLPAGSEGRLRVRQIHLRSRDAGTTLPVPRACDLVLVSGGWSPNLALFAQARGELRWDAELAAFRPGPAHWPMCCAGGANGTRRLGEAIADGLRAGAAAAAAAGFEKPAPEPPSVEEGPAWTVEPLWCVPGCSSRERGEAFVDFQHDVTARDLGLALREGYESIEHVKRYTTTGMGTDQGKLGNLNALGIVAGEKGVPVPAVGVTTFRQPWTPVPFGALVGANRGPLFDPVRRTPMHAWAERAGAVFEDVGQWKRARYFPREGEDMQAAVQREAKAVRASCGMLDASTLGKIDIRGPDAAEFLNRVYTNSWAKLAVGACRYGLMLGEDGMVFDDGVTARLGEDHFHMTTTTGGAARVLAWLENWLQTEWPELRVWCTSVTEQWATMTVTGPKAREVLRPLVEDVDLGRDAFPHMTFRSGRVAGVPARIFRISFTGELSFEVNVPAGYGLHVWEALLEAGAPHGLTVYGTETMHLLRAEKGYIIVGQDTDGTVTPFDLGMGWIVSKKKGDFIGRRSLFRSGMRRSDRKQLVGLLTEDPALVLEEGAQIVVDPRQPLPMRMIGHVTSSYRSPNLGRSIALAMVRGGRERSGQRLWVPRLDGPAIPVEVTSPVFYDPEGTRLHV